MGAQAAYGTSKIKLVDVRVQVLGQGRLGPGIITPEHAKQVADAIAEAIVRHGARVVSASTMIDWSHPLIQAVIDAHPEVVFLTTGGNSLTELSRRLIDAGGPRKEHAMLVGGVTMTGARHPKRGFGPAVDVTKMLLLNPALSGAQAVRIVKATQDPATKMPRPLAALAIAKKTRETAEED